MVDFRLAISGLFFELLFRLTAYTFMGKKKAFLLHRASLDDMVSRQMGVGKVVCFGC